MWSGLAIGLFVLSGLLGYLALMENVAVATSPDKPQLARVVQAAVVHRAIESTAASLPVNRWLGFGVDLEVELLHPPSRTGLSGQISRSSSRPRRLVGADPVPSFRFFAERWRDRLLQLGEVQVYPDVSRPGLWLAREPGQGSGALIPLLCALLGVLCLATSLRYQVEPLLPERLHPEDHEETPSRSTALSVSSTPSN